MMSIGEKTRYAVFLRQKVPEAKSIGRRDVATTKNAKIRLYFYVLTVDQNVMYQIVAF